MLGTCLLTKVRDLDFRTLRPLRMYLSAFYLCTTILGLEDVNYQFRKHF